MMKRTYILIATLAVFLCPILRAETIVLKSGDTIDGEIVRTVGSNVTIRTSSGIGTYHVNELDQAWVDEHYDKIFTEVRQKRVDEVKGLVALLKGLIGKESLSKATPFLTEYRKYVLPVSAGLIAIGLALCFFGWKLFKFSTILGGILSGIMLGLVLGGAIAGAIGKALPEDIAQWGTLGLFLLIGIPFAIVGAKFGRRFAMFGARSQALGGLGSGWMGSIFSLTRFAFFDLSVIWGHALFGAFLIVVGAYCAAVPLLDLPADHLQAALIASVTVAVLLCIFGAVSQIKHLRSEPTTGYRGEY